MDVVTESSGDLFNVHVVLILEFDHACNTVRTSLKFLAIPKMGKIHYVWKTVPNDCIEVKKAEVKVRLLTGTYMLQSKKAKFSNNKETAM
jgi:hypothetical protein